LGIFSFELEDLPPEPGTVPPVFGRKPKQPHPVQPLGDEGVAGDGADQPLFDIVLNSAGATPWAVAEAISTGSVPTRDFVNTKEAKALVDSAPTTIAEGVDKLLSQRLKVALEAAGADFRITPHGAD
jgi:large subunit ribosomal protein L7/L12